VQQLADYTYYVTIALLSLLIIRLFVTGFARTYVWFTIFIITDLFFHILFRNVRNGTNTYAIMYFAAQPIHWILYFGVIFELHSLILREHAGILAFGRKWLIRALGVAALFSVSTLFVNLQAPDVGHPFLDSYHVVERLVYICLFLFLILLIAILGWFPIQLKRNILVMCSVFGGYILVRSGLLLARNILGLDAAGTLNVIYIFAIPVSAMLWLLLLRPSGESSRLLIGHQWNHAEEARIMAQLDAINSSLLRSAKE
jgi:hypothetical protein